MKFEVYVLLQCW